MPVKGNAKGFRSNALRRKYQAMLDRNSPPPWLAERQHLAAAKEIPRVKEESKESGIID